MSGLASVRDWWRARRRRVNGFVGVFPSYQAAAASVPAGAPIGYDLAEAGELYREMLVAPRHDDYPALFWLHRALGSGHEVVEIGGHVGVAYYAFERVLAAPSELRWTILETPAVAQAGRALAAERGRSNLSFVSSFEELTRPAHVLFASGSLQYLDGPALPERLLRLPALPRHVLITKTPVTQREGFYTVQDIGLSYCPYRIHSRAELVDPLLGMGYELVDSWHKERRVEIPGHPERTLEHYSGFYLTRPS